MVQFLYKNRIVLQQERVKLIATGLLGRNAENSGFKVTIPRVDINMLVRICDVHNVPWQLMKPRHN
jgi:methylglyoxal synthase